MKNTLSPKRRQKGRNARGKRGGGGGVEGRKGGKNRPRRKKEMEGLFTGEGYHLFPLGEIILFGKRGLKRT